MIDITVRQRVLINTFLCQKKSDFLRVKSHSPKSGFSPMMGIIGIFYSVREDERSVKVCPLSKSASIRSFKQVAGTFLFTMNTTSGWRRANPAYPTLRNTRNYTADGRPFATAGQEAAPTASQALRGKPPPGDSAAAAGFTENKRLTTHRHMYVRREAAQKKTETRKQNEKENEKIIKHANVRRSGTYPAAGYGAGGGSHRCDAQRHSKTGRVLTATVEPRTRTYRLYVEQIL
jgi:hypothetical protein